MPKARDTSHVVLDYGRQPARFRCLHCGNEHVPRLPAPISAMSKWSKAFVKLHEDCQVGQAAGGEE